ncbi:MAG: hypothetical protein U0L09_10255, partial [Christensenellales bacterium]|nr:hypothetical protein [Christensenellales bacterium]
IFMFFPPIYSGLSQKNPIYFTTSLKKKQVRILRRHIVRSFIILKSFDTSPKNNPDDFPQNTIKAAGGKRGGA